MKLSELFENNTDSRRDLDFEMSWNNKKDAIPQKYHSKVHAIARDQMNRGESPSDAISNAWDITKSQIQTTELPKTKPQSPTQRQPYRDRQDSLGRSLRHDRYYVSKVAPPKKKSSVSAPDGIANALSKATPKTLAKKAMAPVDKTLGDLMDIDKALGGNLNKNSRTKR